MRVHVVLILFFSLCFAAQARPPLSTLMSYEEFLALGVELSPKVNLFKYAWSIDPEAKFVGGTALDYFSWLKRELSRAKDRPALDEAIRSLRALTIIDVKSFIIGESDIDIATDGPARRMSARRFGVKKIDPIEVSRLDVTTPEGLDETRQGYMPAEKIILTRTGITPWATMTGGVEEIFYGKLTVSYAAEQDFATTVFAQQNRNHPILLAVRWIRRVAMAYYWQYGEDYPDTELLFDLDPESEAATRKVIDEALKDQTLAKLLENEDFRNWLNTGLQKGYRSYTNQTAALLLYRKFGLTVLPSVYGGIDSFNRYLFIQYRDPKAIQSHLTEFEVNTEEFFERPHDAFPDGYLYHGAKTERAFRGIQFQSVLPSTGGSAGEGLYGVSMANIGFAIDWGGDVNRVVMCPVQPDAKIVDITRAEGKRVFKLFEELIGGGESAFAKYFGVDIIRYPYDPEAYVVKNAAAIGDAIGYKRRLLSLQELIALAQRTPAHLAIGFISTVIFNQIADEEAKIVVGALPPSTVRDNYLSHLDTDDQLEAFLIKTLTTMSGAEVTYDNYDQLRRTAAFHEVGTDIELQIINRAFAQGLVQSPRRFIDIYSARGDGDEYQQRLINEMGKKIAAFTRMKPSSGERNEILQIFLSHFTRKGEPLSVDYFDWLRQHFGFELPELDLEKRPATIAHLYERSRGIYQPSQWARIVEQTYREIAERYDNLGTAATRPDYVHKMEAQAQLPEDLRPKEWKNTWPKKLHDRARLAADGNAVALKETMGLTEAQISAGGILNSPEKMSAATYRQLVEEVDFKLADLNEIPPLKRSRALRRMAREPRLFDEKTWRMLFKKLYWDLRQQGPLTKERFGAMDVVGFNESASFPNNLLPLEFWYDSVPEAYEKKMASDYRLGHILIYTGTPPWDFLADRLDDGTYHEFQFAIYVRENGPPPTQKLKDALIARLKWARSNDQKEMLQLVHLLSLTRGLIDPRVWPFVAQALKTTHSSDYVATLSRDILKYNDRLPKAVWKQIVRLLKYPTAEIEVRHSLFHSIAAFVWLPGFVIKGVREARDQYRGWLPDHWGELFARSVDFWVRHGDPPYASEKPKLCERLLAG